MKNAVSNFLIAFVICAVYIRSNEGRPDAAVAGGGGFPSDNPWYRGDPSGNVFGEEGGGFTSGNRRTVIRQSPADQGAAPSFRSNNFNGPDTYGYDYVMPGANVYYVLFRNGGGGRGGWPGN